MKQCNLKQAREDSGRSAREIAGSLGLSRSQLYRIESGECQGSFTVARKMRELWPKSKVSDLAIYDPWEFEKRKVAA